jgi:hypothetical protein
MNCRSGQTQDVAGFVLAEARYKVEGVLYYVRARVGFIPEVTDNAMPMREVA